MTEWLPAHDYQRVASEFMAARRHALLADEMGVGKSASTVRACDLVGARTVLVLCPASARAHWVAEFGRFSPMDRPVTALMTGTDAHADVTVCSYDMLAASQKLRKRLCAIEWDVLVLDEAHYLKSRTARRTKVVYGRRCNGEGGIKARHVWRLTGTPIPNFADELWTHLHHAGLYPGSYHEFVAEFCNGYESEYGFRITGHKNVEKLKSILAGFMLRRKKDEVMSLPSILFSRHYLKPGPVDVKLHFMAQAVETHPEMFQKELERVNEMVRAAVEAADQAHAGEAAVLSVLKGLIESTASLRKYVGLSLVQPYLDLVLPQLESGEIGKLVIFAYHRGVMEELMLKLRPYGARMLNGSTDPDKRGRIVEQFQTNPRKRVFIGQLHAAGTAINLTAAHHLDLLEMDWVPANNIQAVMRIHRAPQTRQCKVRYFGAEGGVHKRIMEALSRKTTEQVKLGM